MVQCTDASCAVNTLKKSYYRVHFQDFPDMAQQQRDETDGIIL